MYCGNCGSENPAANKFCLKCGAALGEVAGASAPAGPPQTPAPAASTVGAHDPKQPWVYAGFWRRFAAYVIDEIVIYAVVIFTTLLLRLTGPLLGLGLGLILFVAYFVGPWLYFALSWSSRSQASVGKIALGIKVTDESGSRIGFGRASGRYFAQILTALTLGVGYALAVFTRRRQALHDLVAGTLVVRRTLTTEEIAASPEAARVSGWIAALVIVVVVLFNPAGIGILAAIAIPAYQDYTIRSQVFEGLNLASSYKVAVAEAITTGMRPEAITTEKLNLPTPNLGKYVDAITVESGAVTIQYSNGANSAIAGKVLVLTPAISANRDTTWVCGRATPPADFTPVSDAARNTTVADKYLPVACRQ